MRRGCGLQAPDNPDAEGSVELSIQHAVDAELDPDYAALAPSDHTVDVTVLDNDLVGVFVSPQR